METITLNNGTVIENAHCIEMDDRLFVYIEQDQTMTWAVTLFDHPENTREITENRYGAEKTYKGYTMLYSVSREYGNVNLVLRKG